jgi:hypothetical protein
MVRELRAVEAIDLKTGFDRPSLNVDELDRLRGEHLDFDKL